MKLIKIIFLGLIFFFQSCHQITPTTNMDHAKMKNLSCDIESGVCQPGIENGIEEINLNQQSKVQLIYYTDPICSACWAIEPQLKKFKLEYSNYVNIEYKMGGLLPGWEGFADKANGIAQPSDVAHHWDEVGQHSGMSIDGDIWLEDPLHSSFPPSIAFKAAQKQGKDFALRFLRKIREQLFLEKKNITKEHFLLKAVEECGGNTVKFLEDYHHTTTQQSFYEEMKEGKNYGVRGFPTFIFIGKDGKGFKISGMSGYDNYVLALEKAFGKKLTPSPTQYSELDLIQKYKFLSTTEIAFILNQNKNLTESKLNQLAQAGEIKKEQHKFGDFWTLNVER